MTTGTIGAGTTSYTVGSIMDRIMVSYLTPPDDQYAQVSLAGDIDDADTTISIGFFTIREDEALLRQGSLLELDEELVRVVSYDSQASTVLVTRGEYGTIPTSHLVPLLMNLNPPYSRASVFESVADNIITLYPSLYTTSEEYVTRVGPGIFPMGDSLAVELLTAWGDSWSSDTDIQGTIVDFHQLTGGRTLLLNQASAGSMWVRYRRRMGKAASESDVLSDLGVDERWVNIIMAGASADLFMGRDIPAARTEWVKSVLESENIPVGTRTSISGSLRRYRTTLLKDAMKEMAAVIW